MDKEALVPQCAGASGLCINVLRMQIELSSGEHGTHRAGKRGGWGRPFFQWERQLSSVGAENLVRYLTPAWKAMHGERALQRRLMVELAWAAAAPPLCMSFASCLVTHMLGLPGLLCPEGIVWFFILHKQHLIIRGFFSPPTKFQVA